MSIIYLFLKVQKNKGGYGGLSKTVRFPHCPYLGLGSRGYTLPPQYLPSPPSPPPHRPLPPYASPYGSARVDVTRRRARPAGPARGPATPPIDVGGFFSLARGCPNESLFFFNIKHCVRGTYSTLLLTRTHSESAQAPAEPERTKSWLGRLHVEQTRT